jgi:acetolactate synthase-1/2/3 large subunit
VLNAATPLATAFTDSVPVLLLSGQIPTAGGRLRSGYYHENEQLSACATFTKWRARLEDPKFLLPELDRAFVTMTDGRPGPVLFEVPLDVLRAEFTASDAVTMPPAPVPPAPSARDIQALAELIGGWHKPLLIAGGGVITAGAEAPLVELAERLGAPVFHTFMGKTALVTEHPLAAGLPWSRATSDLTNMEQFLSPLFAEADGLLAVGCRFTQACTGSWALRVPASLAQIDIDPEEIGRHYPVTLGIHADARQALRALLDLLPHTARKAWTSPTRPPEPGAPPEFALIAALRRALPGDAIVAGDITRLTYAMLAAFPSYESRTFLHPAGFVAMAYGLPAALGAKAAFPQRTVVTVVGDGCFLMSGLELATAVQEKLPIIVILINDGSLTLIKAIQQRRYESRFLGVDLQNPDFQMLARAFGIRSWQVDSERTLEKAVEEAVARRETCLIEVRLSS